MRTLVFCLVILPLITPSHASIPDSLKSVVSVLPIRSGQSENLSDSKRGAVPEGSGVAIFEGGYVATAWHVVRSAPRINVRLSNGRILPAQLVGKDAKSDIALLKVAADLAPLKPIAQLALAQRVCAIANAYGLGLSVTCGVVSALNVSNAGINAVEDFIQTDAAINPGSSGGALVDENGQLVGLISAIFASKSDTNIGVNFAVSTSLLRRVAHALMTHGEVAYVRAGWQLASLPRSMLRKTVGVRVGEVASGSPADVAGIRRDDIVLSIGSRRVTTPKSAVGALALAAPGDTVQVTFERNGASQATQLAFVQSRQQSTTSETAHPASSDCTSPEAVCAVRQAVFPIESFDPLASAVRIGRRHLVTNRHAVGNRKHAIVFTPNGPQKARVEPSNYRGDLVVLEVDDLPTEGLILVPPAHPPKLRQSEDYYVVGADIARKMVRVFEPGRLIAVPANNAVLGRIHVTAEMQPGVSGGALVNASGQLVGIAVGGGEGRNEAVPISHVAKVLTGRDAPDAEEVFANLGQALEACAAALEKAHRVRRGQQLALKTIAVLKRDCRASGNAGQYLKAARHLAYARQHDAAIEISNEAVKQVPNSINARLSHLVALQLAGRFAEMLPHARWVTSMAPNDPRVLRFGIQAGVWGGDSALAEASYTKLKIADPRQAQAARRFLDRPPPTPRRR
ncbi:MAG: trypsin-like peptidase domain-containing protein [Hyphomicrobiaceae bacterium]